MTTTIAIGSPYVSAASPWVTAAFGAGNSPPFGMPGTYQLGSAKKTPSQVDTPAAAKPMVADMYLKDTDMLEVGGGVIELLRFGGVPAGEEVLVHAVL
ncbi:hypothetical protein, partial [Mycobacterium sp. 1245499.0]|uniref:hypothetical protein n=1 Tax=Mycobacterium sp. 1245499.0 TaxID=1834074 RepID=UPI0012EAE0EB